MNRLRNCCVVLVIVLAESSPLPDAMAQQDRDRARQIMAPFTKLELGKSLVVDRPPQQFVEIAFSGLPRNMKVAMYSHLEFLLQRKGHPHEKSILEAIEGKGENISVRVFAAYHNKEIDLVEYRWIHRGQELRALVRKGVVRLDIQLDQAKENRELDEYGPAELERVKGFVSSILLLKGKTATLEPYSYELHIPWPTELVDGVSFCSSPTMNIMFMDVYVWFRRVDAYVENRTLSLLFYMKPAQVVGYPGGSTWFSDDFRTWVHQQAREQDKVPPVNNP